MAISEQMFVDVVAFCDYPTWTLVSVFVSHVLCQFDHYFKVV